MNVFLFQLVVVSRNVASLKKSTQDIFEAGKNRAFVHFHGGFSVFDNRSKPCRKVCQLTNHVLELIQA